MVTENAGAADVNRRQPALTFLSPKNVRYHTLWLGWLIIARNSLLNCQYACGFDDPARIFEAHWQEED